MSTVTVNVPVPGTRARWLSVGALAGLLVGAALMPALGPRSARAVDGSETPEHTISVSGVGTVTVVPDVADVQLGVLVQRTKVRDAQAAAADLMTKVIAALRKAGIAEKDIQTSNLSLQPVYDYSTNGSAPRIVGYQLSNAVTATVRDLTKLSDAIDGALEAGANTLNGVTFRVDDPAKAEELARSSAMAAAKAKADALAKAAGVSIIGVASISETSSPTPVPVYYAGEAMADAAKAPTPVLAGTSDVTVTVSVVYLIG